MKAVFIIVPVLYILVLYSAVVADTIYLEDGESYEGKVVEKTGEYVVFEEEDGSITEFYCDEVDRIEKTGSRRKDFEDMRIEDEREEEARRQKEFLREAEEPVEEEDEEEDDEEEIDEEEQETAERVLEDKEEDEKESTAEDKKEKEPIVIKPKITGSGKYTTY